MELELLKFIEENYDWEEKLSSHPYSLRITRDNGYILFKYNQIESDFSIPLVQESRGIIFREDGWELVCLPFQKFFNIQEELSSDIDWESASVYEKLDGSLIKVWYDEVWHVSTNGTIDAINAEVSSVNPIGHSFLDLFQHCANSQGLQTRFLAEGRTYLFELLSPYTKIVVHHPETKIVHIATRDNETGNYLDDYVGIEKVSEYSLTSQEECLVAAKNLPFDEEGYVVRDSSGNMVKIKSPAYVQAHRLVNNGVVTPKRILEILEINESDEFLSYFPEYSEYFDEMQDRIISLLAVIDSIETEYWQIKDGFGSRRELATWAKETDHPNYVFAFHDDKVSSPEEWFENMSIERKLKVLGYDD